MPAPTPSHSTRRANLLIPVAVLIVLHPFLIHGPSCGQDLAFHLQSWLDAAAQLRHGTLYPHWDISSTWNAGEPRFLFYPPLSWMLGAVLTLVFPPALCPTIFIAIALLLSGFTFHKLASEFACPNAALLASTLYVANPYMLFTAFERSALAELLAAAWIPLLLLALLRPTPTDLPSSVRTLRNIAIPLALLWLTNAPAAVIGSYTLALLAILRVLIAVFVPATIRYPEVSTSGFMPAQKDVGFSPPDMPFRLGLTYLAATLLGLTLPAIYLLPAAYERKYIQTAMALLPGLRFEDNFLFTHTPDPAHNAVNHTISLVALTLLLTAAAILTRLLRKSSPEQDPVILSGAVGGLSPTAPPKDTDTLRATQTPSPISTLTATLAFLTLLIAYLLTPISTPLWQHLPNLAYLQFPWRLLILLTPILALSIALLLNTRTNTSAQVLDSEAWVSTMPRLTTTLALLLPLAFALPAYHLFHQHPDPTDDPTHLAQLFTTHHGFPPTDEYTPTEADNDPLRSNNPAYWLANSPNDPAPNTTPTPTDLNPSLDTDDTPLPDSQTQSTPTPHHFTITLTQPSYLVLNLRDYPNWDVTGTGPDTMSIEHYPQPRRDDGLITMQLPRGQRTINITWHRTPDQTLGLLLTTLSLLALALTYRRQP